MQSAFRNLDSSKRKTLEIIGLVLLWGIIQVLASFQFEMRSSVDTDLYIQSAIQITNGEFPEGRAVFYTAYSALIAGLNHIGLSPANMVYIQFLTAIAALISVYKLTERLSSYHFAPQIAALFYTLWFKFQQWNLILYTDAMFSHFVVISVYAIAAANTTRVKLVAAFLIAFTCFLRPTGVGLLFAVAVYGVYLFLRNKNLTKLKLILLEFIASVAFLFVINIAIANYVDMFFAGYTSAEIIYPNISLFIDQPTNLYIPDKQYQPLIRLCLFFINNPVYLLKTSLLKGLLFITHIKPYYSWMHNIFIAAFLYPAYFFAVKGYKSLKHHPIAVLILSFIGFQFITVSLTSENWDGRFLLPILPLVFTLAALGLAPYLASLPLFRKTTES